MIHPGSVSTGHFAAYTRFSGTLEKPPSGKFGQWMKDGMPLWRHNPSKPRIGLWKRVRKTFFRTLLIAFTAVGGIWGSANVRDRVWGDGPIPALHAVTLSPLQLDQNTAHSFHQQLFKQHMAHQPLTVSDERCWQELQPTLGVLKSLSPEIYQWMKQQYETGHIVFEKQFRSKHDPEMGTVSAYDNLTGKLYISPEFFGWRDAYKVGMLVHEFRHSRQNWGKVVTTHWSPHQIYHQQVDYWLHLLRQEPKQNGDSLDDCGYLNQLEDEAYLYELNAYRLLGVPPRHGAVDYLRQRGLLPADLSEAQNPPNTLP